MSLSKMKFDTTEMPFPKNFSVAENNIQEEQQAEGGRSIIQRVRQGVLEASISTTALSDVLKTYMEFSKKDSFVFTYYDPLTETQIEKTVHMEGFNYALVEKSQDFSVTNGIYVINCVLREF